MMEGVAENKEPPKGCSCPPGEGPVPCPGQHALWHCQHEAVLRGTHKIVPVEPTEAMVKAGEKTIWPNMDIGNIARSVYRAMITAATPTAGE